MTRDRNPRDLTPPSRALLRAAGLAVLALLATPAAHVGAQSRPAQPHPAQSRAAGSSRTAASRSSPAPSSGPEAEPSASPPSSARVPAAPHTDGAPSLALPTPSAAPPSSTLPSPPIDLRAAHQRCVRSLVRIERDDGALGSGWVVTLLGRAWIVTNAHVVEGTTRVRVLPYEGEPELAHVRYISPTIDLALLAPEHPLTAPDPASGLPRAVPGLELGPDVLVRGERVVVGGNPGGLYFITTEGVVAGVVEGTEDSNRACGRGHNCLVLDGEAEPGSSGGPIVDHEGRVVGMLWGVFTRASLSIAIHAQTLRDELERAAATLTRRRTALYPVARQPTIEP